MGNILDEMAGMTAEEREQRIQQMQMVNKKLKMEEKQNEKTEDYDRQIYESFKNALKIYDSPTRGERKSTGMCFYRDKMPVYFYTLDTHVYNPIADKQEWTTEIKYITPGSLYPNFTELKTERSRDFLRQMVEGKEISVKNPETNQWETHKFIRRVYDKMTNTVKIVDDKTFNLLNLDHRIKPNYNPDEKQECPAIIRALLASVSGNVITWNAEINNWEQSKPENQQWLERWLYAVVHKRIGDPQLPVPIIFGKGKIGKNALFDLIIPGILGKQACFSGIWDLVTSNFTQFKLGKVFMFVDEAPERSDWNVFKNWTGSPTGYVKIKYGQEFEIDNCIATAVGTNLEIYPFPFEDGKQMIRVSPIKASGGSTFAENTYKILTQLHGDNYCLDRLAEHNIHINPEDHFAVGDALLRGPLLNEWTGKDALQQLVNYLDQNYKKDGFYHLEPLRGQDWDDIAANRKNSVEATAEYITEHAPSIVTVNELYEIYKVIQNERHNNDQRRIQHFSNFCTTIRPMMKDLGWIYTRNNMIKNGTMPDLYLLTIDGRKQAQHGDIKRYEEDFERYIVGTTVPNGIIKRLRGLDPEIRRARSNLDIKDAMFGRLA